MPKETKILYRLALKFLALIMLAYVLISFISMGFNYIIFDQLKLNYAQTPSLTPIVLEEIQKNRGSLNNMSNSEQSALERWLNNFSEFQNNQLELFQANRSRLQQTVDNFAILFVAIPLYLYNRRKIKLLETDNVTDRLLEHEKEIEELRKSLVKATKSKKK